MRELSLHILDICQNSFTANATLVEVEIIENIIDDILVIRIDDNGIGMDEETVKKVIDPFYTTRTTRKVGLGISMFKANAELCSGSFEITSVLGEGTKITATFKHSHIDRAPLGDMPETLMTMVMGAQGSDLVYKHLYNSEMFSFSTQEIKEVLGDVPLDNVDVLMWVKDFVKQGLASLKN